MPQHAAGVCCSALELMCNLPGLCFRPQEICEGWLAGPVVTAAKPSVGPSLGHASLTLAGLNFGTADPSLSASISATACMTSSWLSQTSLLCVTPGGAGGAQDVVVEVGCMQGTGLGQFSYDGAGALLTHRRCIMLPLRTALRSSIYAKTMCTH